MVALVLRLFGILSLEIEQDGVRRPIPLARRSAALLALLALSPGRDVHRSALLEAVWQDDARGGTAACLNTALWRLRKALAPWTAVHGDAIVADARGGLRLREHPALRVDVQEFQHRTASPLSRAASDLGPAEVEALADAVPLYRGDLLVDIAEDWARRERERLRRRFIDTLVWLMQHAMAREDFDEAIRRGRHALELDPLREDIHRELMACLLKRGQRAHALRQFESCRASLRSELAIAPMPETMALYRDVASQSLVVNDAAPPAVAGDREAAARACVQRARQQLAEAERQLQALLD